jgi:hypothetical protein
MRISLTKTTKAWTVPIIPIDGDELGFEIPDELLAMMDLKPGDTIIWEQRDSYSWMLRKKQDE